MSALLLCECVSLFIRQSTHYYVRIYVVACVSMCVFFSYAYHRARTLNQWLITRALCMLLRTVETSRAYQDMQNMDDVFIY